MVITYIYDPLYRLTAADYSTGDPSSPLSAGFYHYTYDEVGNRLTEETHLDSHEYVYDVANRLASVDTVSYTFDDNGNLLDDGVSTYSYDAADRLIAFSGQQSATYAYNGLGDRYQQTVDSATTTYVLDLNAGLTQVLDDGDSTYLYGLGRVAQVNSSIDYFMGDALGSVRQLVEGDEIVLAKSYAPFGEDLYSNGSGASTFAFTGEQTDPNGLVYLRARYYGPGDGRFLSRDTWYGDVNRPLSLNRWMYVSSNPVNRVDPSGLCEGKDDDANNPDIACWQQLELIETTYTNIEISPDNWTTDELLAVEKGLDGMTNVFGGTDVFYYVFDRTVTIKRAGSLASFFSGKTQGDSAAVTATITLYDDAFDLNYDIGTVVVIHEFGHFLDARFGYLSMGTFKDTFWDNCVRNPLTGDCWGILGPECKPFPLSQPSTYGQESPKEDFAETFAEYVWFENGWDFSTVSTQLFLPDQLRLDYMESIINSIRTASNSSETP